MDAFTQEMLQTAQALISEFGGPLTYRQLTDGAPADPSKPWNAAAPTPTDTPCQGVFLNYEAKEVDGNLIIAGDQQVYVSPVSLPLGVSAKDVIIRNGQQWNIISTQEINPAGTPLLYILQVRQ